MKDEKETKLDNLFKKGLEDPANNIAYNEDDWDALEQMLDSKGKRRGIVFWLPVISGIAAMLLLAFGWWYFYNTPVNNNTQQQAKVQPKKNNVPPVNGEGIKPTDKTQEQPAVVAPGSNASNETVAGTAPVKSTEKVSERPAVIAPGKEIIANANPLKQRNAGINLNPASGNDPVIANVPTTRDSDIALASTNINIKINPDLSAGLPQPVASQAIAASTVKTGTIFNIPGERNKGRLSSKPQFAISVIASSDVTGVNSLDQGKVGSNFGAMFSVGIKKFTFTTGAMYAIKPYMTNFQNYHTAYQFKQDPTSVTADCRMLDIPLNLSYQVFSNQRNKISVGTGLSSYFMLYENYKYNYGSAYPNGPESYKVKNTKNYLISNVNLNATFERQINSKFGLMVQPYLKVPIKSVGYSNVKLQSLGVAVGINWNISSN